MLIRLFYMCRIGGMTHLQKAIDAVGNASKLARELGVTPQAVIFWKNGERRVPAEHCPAIERLSGVRCEDLRPDVEWSVLRQAV